MRSPTPDLTTFCRLQPERVVLACRVVAPDRWCPLPRVHPGYLGLAHPSLPGDRAYHGDLARIGEPLQLVHLRRPRLEVLRFARYRTHDELRRGRLDVRHLFKAVDVVDVVNTQRLEGVGESSAAHEPNGDDTNGATTAATASARPASIASGTAHRWVSSSAAARARRSQTSSRARR